jgi:hypothetical protein
VVVGEAVVAGAGVAGCWAWASAGLPPATAIAIMLAAANVNRMSWRMFIILFAVAILKAGLQDETPDSRVANVTSTRSERSIIDPNQTG